jgi:NAD+ kinase
MHMKKIGILFHPMLETTRLKARELTTYLESQGIQVWTCSAWESDKAAEYLDNTDLVLTTGGDGTILRAAQVVLKKSIPILGVNMGTLGFLTEFKADEALNRLAELLNGNGWLDERSLLQAQILPDGEKAAAGLLYALNDIVLARGAVAKLIQVSAAIDEKPLTIYRADGVIMATATGSTGYSLAAGGPVLYPQCEDYLLVPIVSHLTPGHSLVIPSQAEVKLQLITTSQATLSVDGHINMPLSNGAVIRIRRSPLKIKFLRLSEQQYFFSTLEDKLKGKR